MCAHGKNSLLAKRLATRQTANALQGAVRHVDWEQVRQFTVKSSKCGKSRKETEQYGRSL